MLIQDRIRLIIKSSKETPSSFADKIGVKRSNLSHVLSGRNKPSLDFLSKIITAYPNVNASWLITGVTRDGDLEIPSVNHITTAKKSKKSSGKSEIERIVIFSKDGTFSEYTSSEL